MQHSTAGGWADTGPAGPVRVLHVDDEGTFCEMCAKSLERADDTLSVTTETDPRTALDRLADGSFDAVVSDYEMPGYDGLELLEQVRARHPDLPFVLFTGTESEAVAREALAAGATDFVRKGVQGAQYAVLANRLRNAVQVARQRTRCRDLERYERIVEASGDPVYVVDASGRFQYVNDRLVEMTGYAEDALVGEHVSVILPPIDIEGGEELIRSLLKTGRQRGTYEMCIVTADGERVPCENHISILRGDESFRGTVGVVRDIGDRLERERELERQNERLEEFASVVSHDLRNPLNVVQGSIQFARSTGDVEQLDRAARGVERMETLVEDLLTLAREGEQVSAFEAVSLCELATDAWGVVEAPDASLEVASDPTLLADGNRLRQLLENLLGNAVEHNAGAPTAPTVELEAAGGHAAEPGGERPGGGSASGPVEPGGHGETPGRGGGVTVTVGALDGALDGFYVADDGVGIPPGRRETVFEQSYSTSEDGSGFGLAIVERIADAHDWDVSVTESAAGGARFEFTGAVTLD